MSKSRAVRIHRVVAGFIIGVLLSPSVAHPTSMRLCRSACLDEITNCYETDADRTACRRASLQQCRTMGVGACFTPGETLTTSAVTTGTLLAPIGVTARALSASAIDVSWIDNNRAEQGYLVERSIDASSWTLAGSTERDVNIYHDGGLASGTRYFYRVRALGRKGTLSPYSGVVSATTVADRDLVPPIAPEQVTATARDCHAIDVAWTPSSDGNGSGLMAYDVYRNGSSWTRVPASSTSVRDGTLPELTGASYAVVAIDQAGNRSAMSPWAYATTPACPVVTTTTTRPPTTTTTTLPFAPTTTTRPPTTTTTTASTTTSTTRPPTTTTTTASTTTSTTRPPTTTTATTTTSTTTTRPPTTTTSSTTTTTTPAPPPPDTTPPSVPDGVGVSAVSCTQMSVGWNASADTGGSGLRGYRVYRDGALVRTVLAPATSTSDTGLAGGRVYGYAVSAFDIAGNESARSATVSANTPACPDTTPPSVPGTFQAVAASCSQINVSWTASTDSGGSGLYAYNLYRNGAFLKQVMAPATSAADTGLGASTSQSYAASAVDRAGNESARTAPVSATTPPCATASADLVGYIPAIGGAKDVLLDGTGFAWIASTEFGLSRVDLRTPSRPAAVAGSIPPFYGERVATDGGPLAVLTANGGGLFVVDVSTAQPRLVGTLPGAMPAVAMAGRYAYALLVVPGNPPHTDLVTVDLGDPSRPATVGRVTLAGGADVQLIGSLAYVAAVNGGLQIVDVQNPTVPRIIGEIGTPGAARAVAVAGGMAYVGTDTAIVTVDVRNPAAPTVRGSLGTAVMAVAVAGTRLYALGSALFKVIDVSNPAAPALLGTLSAYGAQRVAASGTTAFLASAEVDASRNTGGLYVVDVSTPAAPRVVTNSSGRFDDTGLDVSGTRAVLTGNGLGLKVIDLSDPINPRVLSSLTGTMVATAVAGQYAYVLTIVPGNPPHTDLLVIDVAGATPVVVGRTTLAGGLGIDVVGSLAYVAASTSGLQVVDVANPAAPRSVGIVDTSGTARNVAVLNGRAYVADETALVVVDVSSPSQPAIRGSLATPATGVAVSGTQAFVVGGNQLKAVDVANPAAPALISVFQTPGAQGIDVANGLAFVATPALNHYDTAGGIWVFDVSDASRMRFIEQVLVPGTTRVVRIVGGRAYAGDTASILDVIEVSR